MQITQEKIDDQNALLKIKVEPEDYSDQYTEALKRTRKQAQMPGFRPGKVPMGVIKSRYGKSLLADELNKVLNQSIQSYISEQNLKILGSPIPSDTHGESGNWDNPSDFEFVYELGLAPGLEVKISGKDKFEYYTINIDKKLVDEEVNRMAKRYGKVLDVKEAGEKDMLVGDFVELNEDESIKEGGVMNGSTISLEFIDPDQAKRFKGIKVGEERIVKPALLAKDRDDLGRMLGLSGEPLEHVSDTFKFIVREIKRMEPAELNEEFFQKVFGEETEVKTEDEFRARVSSDLKNHFRSDSDRLFKRDISKKLIEKYQPELPDEFLKKWIRLSNENPISAEEVENDYAEYKRSLQWQLIFNELINNKEIEVSQEEVIDRTKNLLRSNYAQYGLPDPEEKELEDSARRVLSNQDEARKVYDMLYDEKLIAYIKEKASVKEKEVSFDKFVEMASNP
jgi:trigger factor